MSAAVPKPKVAKAKTHKPKAAPTHPKVIDMIKEAIVADKDRKGTSVPAIKKYIESKYKVDMVRLGPHIRRAIVVAAGKGILVRVGDKTKGATGRFRMGAKKAAPVKVKKPQVKKAKKPKVAKKPATPKVKKAKSVAKKPKAVKPKKPKTPKKAAKKVKTPKKK